jgi:hypothetical protein
MTQSGHAARHARNFPVRVLLAQSGIYCHVTGMPQISKFTGILGKPLCASNEAAAILFFASVALEEGRLCPAGRLQLLPPFPP